MTNTVVHVTTLEQWKSVLDVWFKQGYDWLSGDLVYHEEYFNSGERCLKLNGNNKITRLIYIVKDSVIEYSDFMEQQKEGNKMETYYVTQEQLDAIKELNDSPWPTNRLLANSDEHIIDLFYTFNGSKDKALLRYLGGDSTIEFKVKETLYRLWRVDDNGDTVYMKFNGLGTPDWTGAKDYAFTAPLEEIKKHKTTSWEIEEVEE